MNRRHLVRAPLAAALLAAVAGPACAAGPLTFVDRAAVAADTRIVDARGGEACAKASLAGARCLSTADLFDANGRPADFHALRWLLGTIGLTGRERVLVVADSVDDAAAVGALLFLSGQAEVAVLDVPVAVANPAPGSNRSLTREAVFTAPMRDQLLLAAGAADGAAIAGGQPIARLSVFARRYAAGDSSIRLSLAP